MPRKEYNVSQRAEKVAFAAVKRIERTEIIKKEVKLIVFAAARRTWAEGYRQALREVRKVFNSENNLDMEARESAIYKFLSDTNRLK